MIPAHAFLAGTDHVAVGTEAWDVIRKGALAIERQIAARGISLMITDDAWTYRRLIERADAQYPNSAAVPALLPLLNRHVDPICREIRPGEFFALIGTRPERPAPLLATATGARYGHAIRYLLEGQWLWCDRPSLHAPYKNVRVEGADEALDRGDFHLHCGSTWIDIEHQGQGLGLLMARLNVMCAWLKFGAWPVFGTTVPGRHFHSKRLIGRAHLDDEASDVILFSTADILADAERVLSIPPP